MAQKLKIFITGMLFLSLIVSFSCKEAPTVSPEELYGAVTPGSQPGYNYPFTTAVYPADGSTGVPIDTSFIIVFNKPINAGTLSGNITVNASVTRQGNTTSGLTTVTLTETTDLSAGMEVTGVGIQTGTTIVSVDDATTITLSDVATVSGTNDLTFSEPSPLTESTDYTITASTGSTFATIDFIGSYSPIPDGFTVHVTTSAGIEDTDTIALYNPGSYTFTVGSSPDTTDPTILLATRLPAPGATGISLTAPVISVQFDEANDLALSSITSSSVYLEHNGTGLKIPCNIVYNSVTETITLQPTVVLQHDTVYHVYVTTDIQDLSGNNLPSGTDWTFTTDTTPLDATDPGFDTVPEVFTVTDTEAQINWITDEPTNYTLGYGRGDNTSSSVSDTSTYIVNHAVVLNSLTPGRRYYARVTGMDDLVGNTYPSLPTSLLEFNTSTDETPNEIHASENEYGFQYILNNWGVSTSGLFGFWTSNNGTNTELYGQLITSGPYTEEWNSADGKPLFTGDDFTYRSAVEDGMGGVVVVVTSSSGISAKRVNADGTFFDWDGGPTSETGEGQVIEASASATSPYAVPVYAGVFTKIRTGGPAVEMGSTGLSNWFFDDDVDLSGFADGSDVIIAHNGSSYETDLTYVDNGTQDFIYMLGQDDAVVDAGDTYHIGDNADTDTFTATYHDMNVAGALSSGGTTVYTPNTYTLPAWAPEALDQNDIITDSATRHGLLASAPTQHTTSSFATGGPSADYENHLVDVSTDFNPITNIGDYVCNQDPATSPPASAYARITAISADGHVLTLNGVGATDDLFPNGNEAYWICETLATGNKDYYLFMPDYDLYDGGANFSGVSGLDAGDIVINTSDVEVTRVTSYNAEPDALNLDNDIFEYTQTDGYAILEAVPIASGNATPILTNYLVDYSRTATFPFTSAVPADFPVQPGDLVENTYTGDFAVVLTVNDYSLELEADIFSSADIFTDAVNDTYAIYREWDRNNTSNPTDPFYQIVADWSINISDTTPVTVYNRIATGTADMDSTDANAALLLCDNDADFTAGTAVSPNDIVVNLSDFTGALNPNIATVTSAGYIHALAMDTQILSDGDTYEILSISSSLPYNQSDIIDSGQVTSVTGGTTINATTNPGWTSLVSEGDTVYNITDDDYAIVTAVNSDTQLVLSHNASFNSGDHFLILHARGILYVWEETGAVYGRVMTMDESPAVELRAKFPIAAGSTSPMAIPDEQGNALVLYRVTATGELWVTKRNCAGDVVWTTELDTQTTYDESVVQVASDEAGGMVVLYSYNSDIRVQRLSTYGTRLWPTTGGNGYAIDNDGATTVTSEQLMAYISAADDVIVVANNGTNDILAWRVGSTTNWARDAADPITDLSASIQRNPQIFYDGNDTIITWDDGRFESFSAWGIFGIKILADTDGSVDPGPPAWIANSGGTDDYNGVAFILNNYNDSSPDHVIVPFNNGIEAQLIWTDRRGSNLGDIVSYDLDTIVTGLP